MERVIWAQKAGLNWRKYADWNTRYFHTIAKVKKSRSKILCLKNDDDVWILDQEHLKSMARLYFMNIFTTTHSVSSRLNTPISVTRISDEDARTLITPPISEEIKSIIFQMNPIKSPGPEGIQPLFLQKFWKHLEVPITKLIQDCFKNGSIPPDINNSYLCLIP